MPPIRTESISSLLAPDLFRVMVETGRQYPPQFVFLVNVIDMPWNPVLDQQWSGLGAMTTKPQGTAFPFDDPIEGNSKSYEAVPYGKAVEATFEAWDDEDYGYLRYLMTELKTRSNYRMEVDGHNALNEAFVTTNETGFDGASLVSTAHTTLDGRTSVANRPATDVGLSYTAVNAGLVHAHRLTDERNQPIMMAFSQVTSTPENMLTMRELFASSGRPFTTDNQVNALQAEGLRWMVDRFITTTTAWFMHTNTEEHDVNFMMKNRPRFDSFDDPRTMNAVFTVYQRHRPSSFGRWRGWYGSQ